MDPKKYLAKISQKLIIPPKQLENLSTTFFGARDKDRFLWVFTWRKTRMKPECLVSMEPQKMAECA